MEEKIDKIAKDSSYMRGKMDATLPRIDKMLDDHETRIKKTETDQAMMKGKVAVAGGMAGLVVAWISKHFFNL